jgi:CheY-like chemotaxis protein
VTGPIAPGLPVLVAEDDPRSLRMVTLMLQSLGAQVTAVTNGQEALDAILATPGAFRAAVLDLQMPVLSGVDVVRRLRTEPAVQALPVVIVTAFAYPHDEAAAREAGCDYFLTKPLSLDVLEAAIRDIHARYR